MFEMKNPGRFRMIYSEKYRRLDVLLLRVCNAPEEKKKRRKIAGIPIMYYGINKPSSLRKNFSLSPSDHGLKCDEQCSVQILLKCVLTIQQFYRLNTLPVIGMMLRIIVVGFVNLD